LGIRVWGLWFGVWGLGFRDNGTVYGLGFDYFSDGARSRYPKKNEAHGKKGHGFRVKGLEFRV
jgi:hypothetical protein